MGRPDVGTCRSPKMCCRYWSQRVGDRYWEAPGGAASHNGNVTNIAPLLPIAAGAVVAVLGYVGKIIVESWQQWRARKAALQTQLVRLQALLKASRAAFRIQAAVRDRLASG